MLKYHQLVLVQFIDNILIKLWNTICQTGWSNEVLSFFPLLLLVFLQQKDLYQHRDSPLIFMELPKARTKCVSGAYVGIRDKPFHSTASGCQCPQQTGSPAAAWGAEPDWDRKADTPPGRPSGLTETTPASFPAGWHTEWQNILNRSAQDNMKTFLDI